MRSGRRIWVGSTLIACCFVFSSFLKAHHSAAAVAAPSAWFSTDSPTINKLGDLGPNDPLTPNIIGNQDCQQRDIVTRPKRLLPFPQAKQSHSGCVVDTGYGALATDGFLQRQGSTVAGNVLSFISGPTSLMPIPYSSTGLVISGGNSSGSYLWFIKNLDTGLSSSVINTGEVTHKLPPAFTSSLHDASGRLLASEPSTVSFSSNGTWMVVDLPNASTVRVNTETFEVLPFGTTIDYNIGIGPSLKTAISPDGRYAAVASKNFAILRLYDLSTCGAVPNVITGPVACSSRDLLPFIKQSVLGFSSIASMRFRSDYTLDTYINNKPGTTLLTSRYILTAAGQQNLGFQYLGLGDSFAAGEGAYQYKALTDTTENKCHLSQRSYPYLIASALNYGQYESVACSGAKILDIDSSANSYKAPQAKDKMDPKYDDEILSGFLPGYRPQNQFLNQYRPSVITVSAVGNDIGFADKIKRCLDTDTCYNTYEDRLEIVNEVNAQFYRLVDMYTQLKTAGNPQAKIYVIGYPQIGDPDGNCAANVHLNHDELIFAQQLVSYLNSVVKMAAAINAGVVYVDVEDAFAGHKLCETDSWDVAVNGLTAGNDIANIPFIHGPIGNESFHPDAFGQRLFKTKILEQTNNLTQAMPVPNPNAKISDPTDSLPILGVPKANRAVRIIKNYTDTDGGMMKLGETWVKNYSSLAPLIKAGSAVHAWLNSDPVDLGAFNTDSEGNLALQITLPNTVPPGFHTLHLYGKNTSDEDADIYQTVYVTNDSLTSCVVVPTSSKDDDKDGLDDACDPMIDQPPLIVTPDPAPTNPPLEVIVENPPGLPPNEDTPSSDLTSPEQVTEILQTSGAEAKVLNEQGLELTTQAIQITKPIYSAISQLIQSSTSLVDSHVAGINTTNSSSTSPLTSHSTDNQAPDSHKAYTTPWLLLVSLFFVILFAFTLALLLKP